MSQYLIDVNLPSRFSVWAGSEYEHVVNINDEWKDSTKKYLAFGLMFVQ